MRDDVQELMPHARWYASSGHNTDPIYDCVPADVLHQLIDVAKAAATWAATPRAVDIDVPILPQDRELTEAVWPFYVRYYGKSGTES